MACYYDSSFILAAILQDNRDFFKIWEEDTKRLSSSILKIECIISIRRLGMSDTKKNEEWVHTSIKSVAAYFPFITFRSYDHEIEKIIMENHRFALCRTLDAIHCATAFYFKPHLQEDILICTLDKRMREVARILGFRVFPEDLFQ